MTLVMAQDGGKQPGDSGVLLKPWEDGDTRSYTTPIVGQSFGRSNAGCEAIIN